MNSGTQPLDEHVVPPASLAIHASEHAGESRADELRAIQ